MLTFADHKPVALARAGTELVQVAPSPDGHLLAFVSDESGHPEVYLQDYPTPSLNTRVSANGGTQRVWRRDGKELYFISPDSTLMAATVNHGARIDVGTPTRLFPIRIEGAESSNLPSTTSTTWTTMGVSW